MDYEFKDTKEDVVKKGQKASKKKGELRLPMRQVIDNIIFTRREIWGVYRIPTSSFSWLDVRSQTELLARMVTPFQALMSDRQKPLPFQIIPYNMPINLERWEEMIHETTSSWDRTVGYYDYVALQHSLLAANEFTERRVYLVVSLGRRGDLDYSSMNALEVGFKAAKEAFVKALKGALQVPADDITLEEEKRARRAEKDVYTKIGPTSALEAEKATSEEILLATKRMFYPAMPAPYLTGDYSNRLGAGDLLIETEGIVENNFRYLKFTQNIDGHDVEGYRTCLTFVQFPKTMTFPAGAPAFLYLPVERSQPFTTWISGTLFPSEKMKKDLRKKQLETQDELKNMTSGEQDDIQSIVAPENEAFEAIRDLQEMADMLSGDKSPWVSASYHIVVEAHTLDQMQEYVEQLRQEYQDYGIKVIQTPGDQKQLFVEQSFGAPKEITDFDQLTNLPMLPASGFAFATAVGDEIDETPKGNSNLREDVEF